MRDMKISRATPFRANEAAAAGREEAIHYFSRGFAETGEREAAASYIDKLIEKYGPVVDGYPCWHPFTIHENAKESSRRAPQFSPQGFEGLDHNIYFRDAFVTAPYADPDRVIESVWAKKNGEFDARKIEEVPLYHPNAKPVLVTCDGLEKENDGSISKRYALGSMLTEELPGWTLAQCGERWEDMRRHILGIPCGSRSSLFVNQDTGKALREVFNLLNRHGLFGPVRR